MLEVEPFLFNSDGCVEPEKEKKKKKASEMLRLGVSLWPPHPSRSNTSMPRIIFISGLFSLHSSWSESMNAAGRIVDKRTVALFVKTKQTGYISVYYNVARTRQSQLPPPIRHHGEIHCAILIILHCGE